MGLAGPYFFRLFRLFTCHDSWRFSSLCVRAAIGLCDGECLQMKEREKLFSCLRPVVTFSYIASIVLDIQKAEHTGAAAIGNTEI